ncbi:unnamed protein product [marine sediment metagenome]|uniref:Uncharacterized protein n=1 Tax=marine sediment metagenome TaxID=412755 RepID=X1AAL6_9ZZZZ
MKIVELKHRGRTKEDHIAALSPYVNTGKIKFKKSQTTLIYTLSRFPKARYKDEADALAYQLYLMKPSSYNEIPKEDPNCLNAWKKRIKKWRKPSIYANFVGNP